MTDQEKKLTELSELGEFGLIERLTSGLELINSSTIKGIGDDAAVIDAGDHYLLVSTDLLVEGVHFDLTYTPLKHLGYKAAVVNFSDIYAMNGHPKQITVGLAVSSRFPAEALDELYSGIKMACQRHGVDLVGGDTTSSSAGMFLSVTAIGVVKKENVVYRHGAKENDLVCVSGDLGAAYMGLLILEREKSEFIANPTMQPDLQGNDYLLERQLKPEARKDVVEALSREGILPTSMIDISDGLASEILHICKNSQCGCAIYEEKIPYDMTVDRVADEFKMAALTAILNGGEDYELLFTVAQSDFPKLAAVSQISVIGHICEKGQGANLITKAGQMVELKAQGWEGLRK